MKRLNILLLFSLVLVYLSGCGDSGNNPVKCKNDLPSTLTELYDCEPRMSDCYEGILKQSEKDLVLNRLNQIRALHGLSAVAYNSSDDKYAQKSALITAANEVMNHYPDSTDKCYSADGKKGCSDGNLWIGYANVVHVWKSDNMINDWLIDKDVLSLGHRRWLLNPFMKTVAFGRVDKINTNGYHWTASTIKVIPTSGNFDAITTAVNYVAYPEGDYPESAFETNWFLSFSVLADVNYFNKNSQVNFDSTNIQVTNESSVSMPVNSISRDNVGYGLPNNIQWKVTGLQPDVKYTIKIINVKVKGVRKDYQYWFRVNSIS